jgi:molybdopterin/thiamine biosynthesis adenylyltransferase
LQAMEALKVLSGYGESLLGKLLVLDLRSMEFRQLVLSARADCPACSHLHC